MKAPTVTTIPVDPTDTCVIQGPLVRINLAGGCGLPGCNCSPDPYVVLSNGDMLLSTILNPAQVAQLKATGTLELYATDTPKETPPCGS